MSYRFVRVMGKELYNGDIVACGDRFWPGDTIANVHEMQERWLVEDIRHGWVTLIHERLRGSGFEETGQVRKVRVGPFLGLVAMKPTDERLLSRGGGSR